MAATIEHGSETGRAFWYVIPADEPPIDTGDLPDAGRRLETRGKQDHAAWQRQKEALAAGFDTIGKPERALALRNCCTCLTVHRYENGREVRGLAECRDLVCPTGMRARSRRLLASVGGAIEKFLDYKAGLQGLMVTLTIKNCASHELKATVGRVIKASGAMMQRVAIKRAVKAWVRSLELTRNAGTGEWHVHIHMIWFVDRATYFRRNSPLFKSVPKLRPLWRSQMKLDYDPVVDIRPLRGVLSPLGDEGRQSLREVIKYCLKPGSLVVMHRGKPVLVGADRVELYDAGDGEGLRPMTCVPLRAVCDALKSRRLVATSHNLQGDDDLDFTDDLRPPPKASAGNLGRYLCTEVYVWRTRGGRGDFFLVSRSFDEPKERRCAMGP